MASTRTSDPRLSPHDEGPRLPKAVRMHEVKSMSRILVVEDSRTQAEQLRLILEAAQFDVTVAHDGQTGLDVFRASPFDLVISDVLMPGLSGYELCRRIKDNP